MNKLGCFQNVNSYFQMAMVVLVAEQGFLDNFCQVAFPVVYAG